LKTFEEKEAQARKNIYSGIDVDGINRKFMGLPEEHRTIWVEVVKMLAKDIRDNKFRYGIQVDTCVEGLRMLHPDLSFYHIKMAARDCADKRVQGLRVVG